MCERGGGGGCRESVQVRAGGVLLEETAKSKTNRQKRREVVMDGKRDEDEWWGVRGRGRWGRREKVRQCDE